MITDRYLTRAASGSSCSRRYFESPSASTGYPPGAPPPHSMPVPDLRIGALLMARIEIHLLRKTVGQLLSVE